MAFNLMICNNALTNAAFGLQILWEKCRKFAWLKFGLLVVDSIMWGSCYCLGFTWRLYFDVRKHARNMKQRSMKRRSFRRKVDWVFYLQGGSSIVRSCAHSHMPISISILWHRPTPSRTAISTLPTSLARAMNTVSDRATRNPLRPPVLASATPYHNKNHCS